MGNDARDSPLPALPPLPLIALLSSWLPAGSHKPLSPTLLCRCSPCPLPSLHLLHSLRLLYLPFSSQPRLVRRRRRLRPVEFRILDFRFSSSSSLSSVLRVLVVSAAAGLCPGAVGVGGSQLGGEEGRRQRYPATDVGGGGGGIGLAGAGEGKIGAKATIP